MKVIPRKCLFQSAKFKLKKRVAVKGRGILYSQIKRSERREKETDTEKSYTVCETNIVNMM